MREGQFISVEGLDGAGKTTVIKAFEEEFGAKTTAEPSTNWTGRQVRECLSSDETHPLTDFFFFMGDRVDHIEREIRPWAEQGELVVSDRYADSTRAYQPVALDVSGADTYIEDVMSAFDYSPDLTLYLDISVDTAIERCDEEEKYENREFLERVKENYEEICRIYGDRIIVIDGEQSKDDVRSDCLEAVETLL